MQVTQRLRPLVSDRSRRSKSVLTSSAFTIVELLIVIVVIGVLAAITVVSYTGITGKATVASLQSDLGNNSTLLRLYYAEYGSYPTALDGSYCPTAPNVDSKYCLKASGGTAFVYSPSNTPSASNFALTASKNSTFYRYSSDTGLSPTSKDCSYGFIAVPGSATYGTSDFCVMKYEAKADDNGDGIGDTNQTTGSNTWPADTHPISATRKLVSTAAGYPVAKISQITSLTAASSYANNCPTGCHLITEAEWMTIAQNVLSVASNWSGGAVGSGYIYSGHNDNVPATAIEATANDADGYYSTGSSSGNQKRTLTLTNGEVVWDFPGNVYEWTAGQTTGGQPGISGESAYAWKQWTAITANGSLTINPFPGGIGLSGSSSWSSTQGIGQLNSNAGEIALHGFRRGGAWGTGQNAGVLCLSLSYVPGVADTLIGLRVSR